MSDNFVVRDVQELSTKSEKVFSAIVENIKAIRTECKTLGDIVSSSDSNLGSRWSNVNSTMAKPIRNIEDTYLVIKALMKKYVENTIANEEQAVRELEEFDVSLYSLANEASQMLDGFSALKGIGIGASAIVIPGLAGFDGSPVIGGDYVSTPATKYGVPGCQDPEMVTKYGVPGCQTPEITTKYGVPGCQTPEITTKYGVPGCQTPEITTKYGVPGCVSVYEDVKISSPAKYGNIFSGQIRMTDSKNGK